LNLAALHASFGQVSEAKLALREAIMLAQVAEDHVCLQHVLSWLYR
jgi:anaphase-promoting complex subunit 5